MGIDAETLRLTMRLWSCGVTVVTVGDNQQRSGMTASSFTSIALEPPLILVCLHKEARTTLLVEKLGTFGVSILGAHQQNISAQFAGYTELPEGEDRFYQVDTFTLETGAPLLSDAIAWLDCRIYGIHDGGTHLVMIGEVLSAQRKEDPVQPLVYHNRAYRDFKTDDEGE